MLNARVRQYMEASTPGEDVALILVVGPEADLSSVSRLPERSQRLDALFQIYEDLKLPVLDAFRAYERDGLRVVNPLDGTPQVIAVGPVVAWRKFIEERGDIVENPDISMIPNEAFAYAMGA
jgi:hypothetical protein